MNRNVLFVAPHPDDETLGCGGVIQKHKADGDRIYWLIITKAYEDDGFDRTRIEEREHEIRSVAQQYGFEQTFRLDLRTVALDAYPLKDVVSAIGKVIRETEASILYLPNASDVHSDHAVVFNASWSCCKSFRYPLVREVYVYETLSETEFAAPYAHKGFHPNTFVDITPYLDQKNAILNVYASEVGDHPFPRSAENVAALATLRGAQIGVRYAEAFVCLKRVIA